MEAVAEGRARKPHKKYGGLADMFNVKVCPVCGKEFIVHDVHEWAYKRTINNNLRYFCSYGCKQKQLRAMGIIK